MNNENKNLIIGIFAGVIVGILGNLLITSFYEGFQPTMSTAKVIFYVSAILFFMLISFVWIKYK